MLVDREVDARTGTMTIRGFFPNPGNILRPGQYAQACAPPSRPRRAPCSSRSAR